jgi:hypothetical protein
MTPILANLEQIIGQCLEKDPQARIQTMRELAAILRSLSKGTGAHGQVTVGSAASGQAITGTTPVSVSDKDAVYVDKTIPDLLVSANAPTLKNTTPSLSSATPVPADIPTQNLTSKKEPQPSKTKRWRKFNSRIVTGGGVLAVAAVIVAISMLSSAQHSHTGSSDASKLTASSPSPASNGVVLGDAGTETHIYLVSEHEGVLATTSGDRTGNWGHTKVTVRDGVKPVILVLTSYEPVIWHVSSQAPNARIVKIIASGMMPMKVEAPPNIAVECAWNRYFDPEGRQTRKATYQPFPYFFVGAFSDVKSLPGWSSVEASIRRLAGGPVYKFYGQWRSQSFTID